MAELYRPTEAMSENARRGLALRAKSTASRQGGTAVGLARAGQFANRRPVSIDIVRRTRSFLLRAREYYQPGRNTPGTQAYLLWGGLPALTWAENILRKLEDKK